MTIPPATVPAPGQAPLPAANAAELLRRNASDPALRSRPAILFGDRQWTHGQYVEECNRWAQLFLTWREPGRPFHVAVLLDNTPDYLFALGGAGLVGATIVGLNHTRRGEHLLRDIEHTDTLALITEPRHLAMLGPIWSKLPFGGDRVVVSGRYGESARGWAERPEPSLLAAGQLGMDLEAALREVSSEDPGLEPDVTTTWALIFTSGTSAAPKAVICSQKRLLQTGARMATLLRLTESDVGYLCMPLFHSNAVMVGWAPSLVVGCAVGLARKFSASGWLLDVRRYGATYFNYTGKPLSYIVAQPERPDDRDNPLRIAFGNEGAPDVIETFSRRFGVEVIDAFGATEGGIALNRDGNVKPGAMGIAGEHIRIVDEDGNERPPARFDENGHLVNADECVGEIVNVSGPGPFEGYYNNREANERATRFGWYWSGDLGYLDEDRNLYFAGRIADWIRVDGENFPAGPIESALSRHPDVVVAAVYGVPDVHAGDQVMAALVLREGARFDGARFARWLDRLEDLGPKWRPRYVRIAVGDLPMTGTNKVVKRVLVHQKYRRDRIGNDELWIRERGDAAYRPFTRSDEAALREAMIAAGRERFWEL